MAELTLKDESVIDIGQAVGAKEYNQLPLLVHLLYQLEQVQLRQQQHNQ